MKAIALAIPVLVFSSAALAIEVATTGPLPAFDSFSCAQLADAADTIGSIALAVRQSAEENRVQPVPARDSLEARQAMLMTLADGVFVAYHDKQCSSY
ncbi:hypothetical protein [Noviherbaspirillum massiliense]|uniref:hypothetical protein n=1 Tax=Noviherbaspirillum massiliense TaxID=1465823 RepID=UPI0002E3A224|nr:hypothetical protein [Noviherbaspirillum massiliense]